MAQVTEYAMSRASDWTFNFDDPDSIDLGDTPSVDIAMPEDLDLANSEIGSVCYSPAASEEEFVIPPDTQVRHSSHNYFCLLLMYPGSV
jgi:hypothetical protein